MSNEIAKPCFLPAGVWNTEYYIELLSVDGAIDRYKRYIFWRVEPIAKKSVAQHCLSEMEINEWIIIGEWEDFLFFHKTALSNRVLCCLKTTLDIVRPRSPLPLTNWSPRILLSITSIYLSYFLSGLVRVSF